LILGQDTVQREAVVAVLKYHEVHRQLVKGNTTTTREEESVEDSDNKRALLVGHER
jgi:vesicle coat complex subunit